MDHPLRSSSAEARPEGERVSVYDHARQTTHSLNRTAALVWLRSDGATSMDELRAALEMEIGVPASESEAVLLATLDELDTEGLMESPVAGTKRIYTRRELLRVMNLAGVSALVLPSVVLTACVDASDVTGVGPLKPGGASLSEGLTTAPPTTTTTTTTTSFGPTTAGPPTTSAPTTTTFGPTTAGPTTTTTTTTTTFGPTTAGPTTTSAPTTTPTPPTTAPPTTAGPTTTPTPPTTSPPTTVGPTTTPVPPTTAPPTTTTTTTTTTTAAPTTAPPTTPVPTTAPPTAITIDDILAEVYHAVLAGTLEGKGRGRSGGAKLLVWKGFLLTARAQINRGNTHAACALLRVAYHRVDGDHPPPDFVEGPAAPGIAAMIATLRQQMGCPNS